jgi:hypothetical protein
MVIPVYAQLQGKRAWGAIRGLVSMVRCMMCYSARLRISQARGSTFLLEIKRKQERVSFIAAYKLNSGGSLIPMLYGGSQHAVNSSYSTSQIRSTSFIEQTTISQSH